MKVVVTGGSGKAGRYTIQELLAHDHTVTNVDRVAPEPALCPWTRVELTDMGQVYGALVGHDAVVHLAAIPSPQHIPPEVVFQNNVMSTFNVVEAAASLGMTRIVIAGSESILGFPFATHRIVPRYMPIDEGHPVLPQDPYGLGKAVVEEICRTASRRTGVPTVSLRFSWIRPAEEYAERFPPMWENPEQGRFNLWAYVDARDVGRSCRLALEADTTGFEAFYIAAADTYMNVPTRQLIETYFPEVTDFQDNWGSFDSTLDCSKAEALLGYVPQHSWRDHLEASEGSS
jgi:nucleoside-diphosphate-sugar epimerase